MFLRQLPELADQCADPFKPSRLDLVGVFFGEVFKTLIGIDVNIDQPAQGVDALRAGRTAIRRSDQSRMPVGGGCGLDNHQAHRFTSRFSVLGGSVAHAQLMRHADFVGL
ncbi:hypothetical protein D3C81_1615750 [compost metagenome]